MYNPNFYDFSGSTRSGKTHLVAESIKHADYCFDTKPSRFRFYYNSWQPTYDKLLMWYKKNPKSPKIEFKPGLPKEEDILPHDCVILDDMAEKVMKSSTISKVVTEYCHHRPCTTMLLCQNLYTKGSEAKTIRTNVGYTILMKSRNNLDQIQRFGRSLYGSDLAEEFVKAYKDATSANWSYLLVDNTFTVKAEWSIRSNCVLPSAEPVVVYPGFN